MDLSVNIPEKQKEKESVYISKPSTSTSSRKRNNQKRHIKKKKHQKIIKITDDAEEEESQQDNNENNGENEEKTEIFLEKTEKDHEMLPKKEKEEYIPNNCSQEIFKTPQENEISKEKNEIPPNKNEKQTEKISSSQEERKNIEEIAADKVFEENDELPFRPIDNKKLDIVPYLDKDLYLLYEPNYKIHKVNYEVIA